jgi:serine/threonine-protein kinase
MQPGDVFAGKYRVDRVLGAGGMGVVLAAHHTQLDTRVAIKLLLPAMLERPEAVRRFAREARAAAKITTEHVARVFDVGTLENGAPYMVMELLDGMDLGVWLENNGPLPPGQAVDFVLQACVAIAEAHSLGIVHRDLKPANLFCIRRPDGQLLVKVLDFGISKMAASAGANDSSSLSMTKTSAVMGSPFYMSPEQMRSAKSADAQSDLWSLGVILYELLLGTVPFVGQELTEVVVQVTTQPPPPMRARRPELPRALEAVIFTCLEKEPSRRYGNVADLAIALRQFAPPAAQALVERIAGTLRPSRPLHAPQASVGQGVRDAPQLLEPTMQAGASTAMPVSSTLPELATSTRRKRSRAGLVAIGGVAVLLAGGLAVPRLLGAMAHARGESVMIDAAPLPVAATARETPSLDPASAAPPTTTVPAAPPAVAVGEPIDAVDAAPTPVASVHPGGGHTSTPHPSRTTPPTPAQVATVPSAHGVQPGCDPPYTLDDQGRKRFKPQCYLNK